MTPGEMCWQINRAAAIHEMETGKRPEVIVVSRDLYYELSRTLMVVAHLVEDTEKIGHEERLFGMRLDVNPMQRGMKYILGMEFELEDKGREEHEQIHDHREPGEGSGDGSH